MPLSPTRLAFARLRHHRSLAAALGIGMAAAIALAVAVPLLQALAAEAGLQAEMAALGDRRYVSIEDFDLRDSARYQQFQSETTEVVAREAGAVLRPGARYNTSAALAPTSLNGQPVNVERGDPLPFLAYYEGAREHVVVVSGTWPRDPEPGADPEAAMAQFVADAEGVHAGDRLCLTVSSRPGRPFCLRVSGTWRATTPGEEYWTGSVPGRAILVGQAAFFAVAGRLPDLNLIGGQGWVAVTSTIHAADAADLSVRLHRLRGLFTVRQEGLFVTGLDAGIDGYLARSAAAAATGQVVSAALVLVALYSLAFVAGLFLEAQAQGLAVLGVRGWSRLRAWAFLCLQFGLVGAVAIPVGLAAAAAVALGVAGSAFPAGSGRAGYAEAEALLPPALAALAGTAVVLGLLAAAAARRSMLDVRRAASRPQERPWWRWRGLDLILGAAAVPLLVEARVLFGAGAGSAGGDPIAVALPSVALVFVALASLRLLPIAAAQLVRLGGGGLAAALAGWQLTRRPVQHARLALLVAFAVAVGLFSAVYSQTDTRNTLDRVAYASGADVRATYTASQQPPDLDAVTAALPGVAAVAQVFRSAARPGRSDLTATLLAVPVAEFEDVSWTRPGLDSRPLLGRLAAADPDGLVLPGGGGELSVWAWSPGLDGRLEAALADDSGRTFPVTLGGLGTAGWSRLTARLPAGLGGRPRLVGLQTAAGPGPRLDGDIALSDLALGGTVLAAFDRAGETGWWHDVRGAVSDYGPLAVSSAHPRAGRDTAVLPVHLGAGSVRLRPPASDRPLPAVVSALTLSRLGIGLNQPFTLHVDSHSVQVAAIATVDYFPTLYPADENFLVTTRDSLLGRLGADASGQSWPNELWLRLSGPAAPVVSRLSDAPLADLHDRAALAASTSENPLRLALHATLAIGFAAALAMAAIGFGLHFLVLARVRLGEYAILRANGLPQGAVRRSLAAEQGLLLVFSVLDGTALGLLLAWAVVPSLRLGDGALDLVPPTTLVVDPLGAAAIVLLAAGGCVLAGVAASRLGGRLRLVDELRLLA